MEFKKTSRPKHPQPRANPAPPPRPHPASRQPHQHPPQQPSRSALLWRIRHAIATIIRHLRSSPKSLALTIGVTSVFIIGIAWLILSHYEAAKHSTASTAQNGIIENLEYQTVLPEGKTITQLGGWKRVSPLESTPVYAYSDSLENISISVSQQPLPEAFASGDVAELAKKFNATSVVDTSSTKVYIGTSAKGPQSIIFAKNGLLILIKSEQKISDKSWSHYANSLS